ncbi:MAG: glycoside hydrolase family 32 protein [Bacteroidota bacterium]
MKGSLLLITIVFMGLTGIGQPASYKEPHRPQFHFSPPAHWMNDPNGMVFYKDEYHLFYQYYPDSTVWGPMHWGHAVSKDMVHWQHLPIALYPDSLGYIFSGSVVVDKNNTSGFKKGAEDPLVAIFTYHNMPREKAGQGNYQYQGIAYSNDKGRTWKKYAANPVIKNTGDKDFRDPKVFWHAESKHWVMSLSVANKIAFYHSKNLKDWAKTGEFGTGDGSHGGVWECPDLFPMKLANSNETKWILIVSIDKGAPNGGSATQYFVGDFDGKVFKNENPPATTLWLDNGPDNYAGVTWSNIATNRRLFLGWMGNWQYAQVVPTEKWRSAMTVPRELTLAKTDGGIRVLSKPVKELETLRGTRKNIALAKKINQPGVLSDIMLEFDIDQSSAKELGIEFSNSLNEKIQVGFSKEHNLFYIDRAFAGKNAFSKVFATRHFANRISKNKNLKMRLLVDRASIELFADDGQVAMTEIFFPNEDFTNLQLYQHDGEAKLLQGIVYELKPGLGKMK